jgi:aspartate carbamoyltransferase catalytic subunit
MKHLLTIGDLTTEEIDRILAAAHDYALTDRLKLDRPRFTVGLVFLSSSLRTRAGFAEAVVRLGGTPIDLSEMRWDPNMSAGESFADTLRTVSGIVDVVVVRAPIELANALVTDWAVAPVVCGGDRSHHPTQALIDVFAIEQFRGPIALQRVAICGDLTMRATRSLLEYFVRRPPAELILVAPESRREHGVELGETLSLRTTFRTLDDLAGIDVLSMCGLAPKQGNDHLDDAARAPFILDASRLRSLPADATVLSPMPVIDEIAADARSDERVRMFEQSDLSVAVRMAVLDHVRSTQ